MFIIDQKRHLRNIGENADLYIKGNSIMLCPDSSRNEVSDIEIAKYDDSEDVEGEFESLATAIKGGKNLHVLYSDEG